MTEEKYAGPERREESKPSPWSDPKTWMTLFGLVLSFMVFISTQLAGINGGIQALREQNAAYREQLVAAVRRVEALEHWKEGVEKDKKDDDKRFNDYQYSVGKTLGEIKGQMEKGK